MAFRSLMQLKLQLRMIVPLLLASAAANVSAQSASAVYGRVASSVGIVVVTTFEGELVASGSAVTVGPQTMVTNRHVLFDGHRYFVLVPGAKLEAFRTNCDSVQDLCLLSVPSLDARPVEFADPAKVAVGDTVYAIGAPNEIGNMIGVSMATKQKSISPPQLTISNGMITALRPVEDGKIIQTNAAISPGSSGGGLFDVNGRLAGITTFNMRSGQSLNMALPVNWVERLGVTGAPRASAETAAAPSMRSSSEPPVSDTTDADLPTSSAPAPVMTEPPVQAPPPQRKSPDFAQLSYWLAGIPVVLIVLTLLRRRSRNREDFSDVAPVVIPKPDPLMQECLAKVTAEVDAGQIDAELWSRLLGEHKNNETATRQAYIQRHAARLVQKEKDRLWSLATQQMRAQ